MDWARFWYINLYSTLFCKRIWVSPEIRAFSVELCSKFWAFTRACRLLPELSTSCSWRQLPVCYTDRHSSAFVYNMLGGMQCIAWVCLQQLTLVCRRGKKYHWPSVLWRCWLGGRKGIWPVKNMSGGVLVWLSVWSEVQICIWPSWYHCHPLSVASVKSRLVLPFWYRLTWVVTDKGLLNVCV